MQGRLDPGKDATEVLQFGSVFLEKMLQIFKDQYM